MNESLVFHVVPRLALSATQAADVLALCEAAYEEPFADILAAFPDATHVLASTGGSLVSHALWVPRTCYTGPRVLRTAYVEAVATAPAHQGRGYASATLRALATQVQSFDVALLSPSDAAFYARLGWERWTGPLAVRQPDGDVPTPDEEVMLLRLPGAAALDATQTLVATWRPGDIW